jgi:putative spermidine/putrescine transport system ATP-binding protein/mannopine transport system ATP-binding protein
VQVIGLAKHYGDLRAVDDVSLDIRAGEFLALLGPSGSGKTTILMTIAGFATPTHGDVLIDSRSVANIPPSKRNLGMVFQRYALFPHMTVFQNIAYPLQMRGVPAPQIAVRVDAALGTVRLRDYARRMPNQLSGGEQQRIALARAIVYRPPVLLMDEPLGALDRKLREQLQLEIKHLQKQLGTTVIYVTHDQEEALTMADRIAVLHQGVLQQVGTPEDLYEQPANSFVAGFIGDTNFLDGVLVKRTGTVGRVAVDGGPTIDIEAPAYADVLREGTSVRIAIRPERIRLSPPDAGEGPAHQGLVHEAIYVGASIVYVVGLGERVTVMARVPTGGADTRWRPGDRAQVSWRPDDARVYATPRLGRDV